ncbi:MAG: L-serine ammonia-lyase [Deltaproteobacteria bacterium]|jgi:L-serine dehydratase|nr:L-serine ammonia-lyase [Deltaproteobacteria bacterium]
MRSVLEMFKVGLGPSSSHTFGPMAACRKFFEALEASGRFSEVGRMLIELYGSLSLTGLGHGTDRGIFMALAGGRPETIETEDIPAFVQKLRADKKIHLNGTERVIGFDPDKDLLFMQSSLPLHENGMKIKAFAGEELVLEKEYYSVGGGFIKEPQDFGQTGQRGAESVPYPFYSARQLLKHCEDTGMSISTLVMRNESALRPREEVIAYCMNIFEVMQKCMRKGLEASDGYLPGPDRVPIRAPGLKRRLKATAGLNSPLMAMDWLNLFAMAVSEQNAQGGRVVTAPTNGSCGVIPAVLAFYDKFIAPLSEDDIWHFLLCSAAIGLLYSMNGSISGAEVGCQGEIGVACSMAAAGLVELYNGSPHQVCAAAEIGMEHNLGLTCDAVRGMVQIPCIERNAMNAVKAVNAAGIAMQRALVPSVVSLDNVIEVMYRTGKDLKKKYRETALGGLAKIRLDGHPYHKVC